MDLVKLSQFLQKCSLHVITVEDWILIQRSSFDLHIDDLPYHSVQGPDSKEKSLALASESLR